jgi:hypothetical protein
VIGLTGPHSDDDSDVDLEQETERAGRLNDCVFRFWVIEEVVDDDRLPRQQPPPSVFLFVCYCQLRNSGAEGVRSSHVIQQDRG